MLTKEYSFSCESEDLIFLSQLMLINEIPTKIQKTENDLGEMGYEEIIIALISSAILPSILDVIKVWLENRQKELTIIDNSSGKEFRIKSSNGKSFSEDEMKAIMNFFQN